MQIQKNCAIIYLKLKPKLLYPDSCNCYRQAEIVETTLVGSRISDKETTSFLVISKRNEQKRRSFIVVSAQND